MAATERMFSGDALDRLAATFVGEVILPSDEGDDGGRRVWNAMIDRRPALIVRPTSVDDVVTALRFGRDSGLTIAVRSGGHSVAGYSTCDDGLVIDLGRMTGVSVDPVTASAETHDTRRARWRRGYSPAAMSSTSAGT